MIGIGDILISTVPVMLTVPDWLALGVAAVSGALAILTVALMFFHVRHSPREEHEAGSYPSRYIDPVLVISAMVVIVLAIAAYASR